jgi:hypothetical protein
LYKILVSLPTNKSGDVYGLHNRALRMLASEDKEGRFERLLANLFTACLTIRYFAEAWKTALIVMIPKRGKSRYDLAKSWRPLALLSLVGKILEKIVARRLQSVAIKRKLVSDRQFAFSGRSTEDALIQHLDFVYRAWSDGSTVFHLCLDLKGAYDRVIRQKLLEILAIFGFPRHLLLFMYSYSRGRGVKIRIPGFTSEEVLYIFLGIFQGSPLSALLFAFYTTPILEYFMRVWEYEDSVQRMLWAFADDFSLMALVFSVPGKAAKRRLDLVSQGIATAHNDLIERFGHHGELRPQSSPDVEVPVGCDEGREGRNGAATSRRTLGHLIYLQSSTFKLCKYSRSPTEFPTLFISAFPVMTHRNTNIWASPRHRSQKGFEVVFDWLQMVGQAWTARSTSPTLPCQA